MLSENTCMIKETNMRWCRRLGTMIFFMLFSTAIVLLGSADERAREIIERYYELETPESSHSIGTMVLIDQDGNRRTRRVEMYTDDTKHGENSFIEVLAPADVEGIRFLTIAHEGDDEQRIYLPALGTSRKISGSGKRGRFLGSDIYYYDLEDHDIDEFTYSNIGAGTFDGRSCDIIEAVPVDSDDPYSRMVQWLSKEDSFAYKIEMYHKNDPEKLIKTMLIIEVMKQQGVIIPTRMVVENHPDNHKTLFLYDEIQIDINIDENIFTVQYLER